MNNIESIRHRRSVRTFDGSPLSADDKKKIRDFAAMVENPYDIPITWRLLDVKRDGLSSPVITGADTFIAGKLQQVPHAEEAFGYTFEKVLLFAESMGLGSTWIAGTMDRKAFERAMGVKDNEVMPCVSPLGRPAKKMSLRETMMRKGVKADSRMDFGELFFDGSFDRPLTPEAAGETCLALELVRLAPSAVNKQPWRVVLQNGKAHFYEKRSRGYVREDGWDLQKVDMGIALCHFEIGAAEQGFRPRLVTENPGITVPEGITYIATYVLEK